MELPFPPRSSLLLRLLLLLRCCDAWLAAKAVDIPRYLTNGKQQEQFLLFSTINRSYQEE